MNSKVDQFDFSDIDANFKNSLNDFPKNKKVSPPLRYPGSKYRASKHIMPFIQDVKHEEYREPFFGGGAIFFKKDLVDYNWINDIDEHLMCTYKVLSDKNSREILINMLDSVETTKEYFNNLKKWSPETEIEIAFRYFVINRTAYSGIMKQPNFGFHATKSVQPEKWPERIRIAGEKLENAVITCKHFKDVITTPTNRENVFMFVDPPYYKADQKRAYLHSFKEENHQELVELLKNTSYKFCLTYDNCEEIKEMYSWANIHEASWMYHTANSNSTTRKMGKELIITNY